MSDLLLNTPWATVLHAGKDDMPAMLTSMLEWLLRNGQMSAPAPPELPTEDSWAERVATLCGYLPAV